MLVQKIIKNYKSDIEVAQKYLGTLLLLNDIPITGRQLEVLSFIAIRGTILTMAARRDCTNMFNISRASLNNTIYDLRKKGLIVKGSKVKLHPALQLDFTQDIALNIGLFKEEEKVDNTRTNHKEGSREDGNTSTGNGEAV